MNDVLHANLSKSIQNSPLIKRYKGAWSYYKRHDVMPYHNLSHAMAVLVLAGALYKHGTRKVNKQYETALYLAASYHDAGHSGLADSVVSEDTWDNIGRATYILTINENSRGVHSRETTDLAVRLIDGTRYPTPETDSFWDNNKDSDLTYLRDLLVDADILHGLMPGMQYQVMVGMNEELNRYREIPMPSNEQMLITQLQFIIDYQPRTDMGRAFKNRFFPAARDAWQKITLNRMREEVLAEHVSAMATKTNTNAAE